ncbi:MAG TPA: DUF447 family protein [Methanocorpusculum sp.]|nr:DUF447 family protein [Methanocorpusculum sp.]
MGLLEEGITEIIAVTKDNAAPIGIILREGQAPKLILFKGSKTEENIRQYGWMTANFVSDSLSYPKYAFSDVLSEELASDGECQYLKSADAWILFKAEVTNETDETYLVKLTEVKEEILRPGIRRVNRGFDAVIDATVHATRYVRTEAPDLKERILYDLNLIRKCGGKQEQKAKKIIETVCKL